MCVRVRECAFEIAFKSVCVFMCVCVCACQRAKERAIGYLINGEREIYQERKTTFEHYVCERQEGPREDSV